MILSFMISKASLTWEAFIGDVFIIDLLYEFNFCLILNSILLAFYIHYFYVSIRSTHFCHFIKIFGPFFVQLNESNRLFFPFTGGQPFHFWKKGV